MDCQDWKPVILKKKSYGTTTVVKKKSSESKEYFKEYSDEKKTKYVGIEIGKKIQQARLDKKMTQKQLAQKLNCLVSVVQSYENGKAKYNGEFLSKIGRILNINLSRKCNKKTK